MTDDKREEAKMRVVDVCRRVNRRAGASFAEKGIEADDIAIAAVYSAHDLAMHMGKSPSEAIEWMRTALDVMERQLLAGIDFDHA